MKLGYIGLGKMGQNMVLRLLEKDHQVVVYNRSSEPLRIAKKHGATPSQSISELVSQLSSPRIIWLMLPAGKVTDDHIHTLSELLEPGDFLVDGANSFYKDSVMRGEILGKKRINFVDVGVSGGPDGARHGACLMVGGDTHNFQTLEPLFRDLAAPKAYAHFPGIGAGHFVKMIHNGIEYGMMQAIAEGFGILKESDYNLDLEQVANIYNQRSVIESRLIDWAKQGFSKHGQNLDEISSTISHSGEGEWTIQTAQELNIEVPVIKQSFQYRLESSDNPTFIGKVVSMLRHQFGGHSVMDKKK